jgi:hypothetical protein
MSYRKPKTAPKQYMHDARQIKALVLETMNDISQMVGKTLGPGGKIGERSRRNSRSFV